ncbi:LysM peptidoglycan-binding domain-containing protein [candidate division KSB3 bacterium]|uniref:LysM peptidoglycan-binding domain-containing protein n=1 Tax=candidate division KSB3 bacterium TaxID=2044937 RepID=A0A9D5JVF4_9BACT|nr:LysM peptidoglycan-binding domain-containing protein [candidate division KSB3 bacterium]MBD3324652.1 LysM peptidoglycan-binding domain-containing protein [candidate division KSB3 bacterium]
MKRYVWLGCVSLLLGVLGVGRGATASSTRITDVQYWLAPDHIQTIISLDAATDYSSHYRSDPDRFVLEIPNCQYIHGKQTIAVNDVLLQRIRVQRLSNGTTQVVFDLSEKVEAEVQFLSKFNGQPERIVVNLFDEYRQEQTEQQRVERLQMTRQLKQEQHYIVVLDPGHGGRDPGAIGRDGRKEKDIVLDIAQRMKKLIEQKAPSIKVYLTRDGDYFLSLRKRTEIARDYNADLFISLHVNANPSRKVHGFSVYTLSEEATDEAAKRLAEKENAADLFGGVETPTPDEDTLLKFVLADLSTTASLQHSLEFGRISVNTTVADLQAYHIQKEGLKRANFIVLRTADMPAVLVEACYISNARESKLLNQKEFRTKLAQSLAKSTIHYFDQMRAFSKPQYVQFNASPPAAAPQIMTATEVSHHTSPAPYKVHVVKSGESLSVIAGKYQVDLSQLRQVNRLASADLIYVGQRLWIP